MKFTISKKLLAGFASVIVLTVSLGVYSVFEMKGMNTQTTEIADGWLTGVEAINNLNYLTESFARQELLYTLVSDEAKLSEIEKKFDKLNQEIEDEFNAYEKLVAEETDREALSSLKTGWEEYMQIHSKLIGIAKSFDISAGISLEQGIKMKEALDAAENKYKALDDIFEKMVTYNHDGAIKASEEASQIYKTAKISSILLVSLVVIVGALIAWYIGRIISRPLKSVVDVADKIAVGDLTSEKIVVKSNDEIADLAKAINDMSANLKEIISGVRASSLELAAASEQTTASMEEIADASEKINELVSAVSDEAEKGRRSTIEASDSLNELASLVQSAQIKVENTAKNSAITASSAEEGTVLVEELTNYMNQISDKTQDTESIIKELEKHSKEIESIVDTITSIAEQTNLLALNASIEAARAGEHGRGFAVVADEVRKLAEQSNEGAREVANLIRKISEATSKSALSMSENKEIVKTGVQAVEKTRQSFNKIYEAVNNTASDINTISEITKDEVATSDKIVALVESLAKGVQDTANNAKLAASTTNETTASIQNVTAGAEETSGMATQLTESVEKFKL